jgi:hypothetical protein
MHLGKVAALGTCKELEASLGVGHTLNDVFIHYAVILVTTTILVFVGARLYPRLAS